MGGTVSFDERDVAALKKIKNVKYVVPFYIKFTDIQGPKKTEYVELGGANADLFPVLNLEVEYGEAFKKSDADRGAKKIVIGPKIAEKLFGTVREALDQNAIIDDQNYKIIGITRAKGGGGLGAPSIDDHIWLPYKSIASYNSVKTFYAFYIKADKESNIPLVKDEINKVMEKRYKKNDFSVGEQTDILSTVNQIFGVMNFILVAIGAISLLVGGIGIMNIMYVSVYERIREIGIRRAFGATNRDIMSHFISEAVFLSLFGGLIGLIFSYLVVLGIRIYFPAYIDVWSVIIALGVSSLIGVIFGVVPARKASCLDPVEAMRYE